MVTPKLLGYLSVRDWRTRLVFWSAALSVGVTAAIFTNISNRAMGWHSSVMARSPWWSLVVSPVVLMVVVFLTRKVFPGTQGSGIPQTIAALRTEDKKLRHGVLSLKVALGKVLMTLLGFLGGASIGREGPTVHIGASMMYSIGRLGTKNPKTYLRGLIMAGGAAGIAAAFNTPIAGVIFAIEEMARFYEERSTGMLLVAVIIAGLAAMAMLGNYTYFGVFHGGFGSVAAWGAVPLCGIAGGLLGGAFSRGLIAGMGYLRRLTLVRALAFAAVCGLVIACIGLLSSGASYGTGYEQARQVLSGEGRIGPGFAFYKMLATGVSYFSGVPGGIFSPSLSAGAGLGADLAPVLSYAPFETVVLLGMVAYFTGVVQTPLTASVIVMEMVDNHDMVFPIMATAFIALAASKIVCRTPIYWALADEFMQTDTSPAEMPKSG